MRIWSGGENEVQIPGSFRMELDGNRELFVEGCQAVISYKPEMVRIALKKLIFSISGSELTIENMNGNSMVIRGQIVRLEFMN